MAFGGHKTGAAISNRLNPAEPEKLRRSDTGAAPTPLISPRESLRPLSKGGPNPAEHNPSYEHGAYVPLNSTPHKPRAACETALHGKT